MRKIQDTLQAFFLILIPVLAVALVVGMLFGWIDLGAILNWIGVHFAQFCLVIAGGGVALFVVVTCLPGLLIALGGGLIAVVAVALIGLL